MDSFKIKTEIISGQGSVAYLNQLKDEKVFIVADPFMVQSKMINMVTDQLTKCQVHVFSDVMADPPMEKIAMGIVAFEAFAPTVCIGFGGGSAIDCAKGIYIYANHGQCTLMAIPTTSGTGSEVTKFAVITHGETGQKIPLVNDEIIPDVAILDVDFVTSVPGAVAADTGMDVLTHAIEAYVSTEANEFSHALAEKAVSLVFTYLARSVANSKDIEARGKMHQASALAGMAFNSASLGLNHAIAHNLGARLHLPHGRINAILLPKVIAFNSELTGYTQKEFSPAAKAYADLSKAAHIEGSGTRQKIKGLISNIEKLMKTIGVPLCLSQTEVTKNLLEKVKSQAAEGALNDPCLLTNPRNISKEQIQKIIESLWTLSPGWEAGF